LGSAFRNKQTSTKMQRDKIEPNVRCVSTGGMLPREDKVASRKVV